MTTALRSTRGWPRGLFRLSTTLVTVLVLTQAMLAGDFLSGRFESLALHARNGSIVASALLAQTVTAIVLWRKAAAPSWPVRTSVIQLVIAAGLIPLGEARMLAIHIPVAVGLAVGTALLTVWAWRWEQ